MWQKHNIQIANFDLASLRVIWFSLGNGVANCVWLGVTTADRRAAQRKLDQRRDYRCAVALSKRARMFLKEFLPSSPGEFPTQHSREDGFSGLIFDL